MNKKKKKFDGIWISIGTVIFIALGFLAFGILALLKGWNIFNWFCTSEGSFILIIIIVITFFLIMFGWYKHIKLKDSGDYE